MLTPFGKFCRKLRIDNGELLKDMASKLNVTSSYLSAVENGKRNVPQSWKSKIIEIYKLNEEQQQELINALVSYGEEEPVFQYCDYCEKETNWLHDEEYGNRFVCSVCGL